MAEIGKSINQKNSILLSRNQPVALVVGAAGFLGSYLTDKLLEKNIQVVGVDNLETGRKENLRQAIEDKNFHLIIESAERLNLNLPRLDYLFIIAEGNWDLSRLLSLFKETKCRCLFVSLIDLYDKENSEDLEWFRGAESKIARFATSFNLNARVLRLGPVYGPRMHFRTKDPLVRLIQQTLTGNLQKEIALEFSSRAMFVSDAVNLIIRTIFSGSTSQKIFDGVELVPVKVSEIKQVLLDPIWYETRDFTPSELPPWPTPNLEKTVKVLSWHPIQKLVAGLRETLSYFKDNEIHVPKLDIKNEQAEEKKEKVVWDENKKKNLELFRQGGKNPSEVMLTKESATQKNKQGKGKFKSFLPLSKIYLFLVLGLVTYAIIWPLTIFGWGMLTFQTQLNEGLKNLTKGEFDQSLSNINEASNGVVEAKSIYDSLEPIRKTSLFQSQFEFADNLFNLAILSTASAKSAALGTQQLLESLKAITGEKTESPLTYFNTAQVELSSASENLSKVNAALKDQEFNTQVPGYLKEGIRTFSQKLTVSDSLVKQAWAMSVLLPKLVGLEGAVGPGGKNYLIILQNNMELRPTGGFIGSFAKVSFEGGKLKKIEVNDVYAIDGQLKFHVEPPKEINEDLGQKNWYMRDANWEPDFPTSARQVEWFYNKEAGERVEGVVALDMSAMERLLGVVGSLDLADYNEKITADNLFEKAITHAEVGFFPGSQAKKSFLTALTNQIFNKIFFLPQNNWSGIISALGQSLDEKHISVYLDDPKLFSYLDSQNWIHALPRQASKKSEQSSPDRDFLSLVEANLGANKVNYYLDRSYNLETVVGKEGEIRHRVRVSYTNRSPSDTFPGGKYKNRLRIYLPFGSKLNRVLWGENEITKNASSFVDYGRSGYSMLLELMPKEQKTLVLDYSVPVKLEFKDGKAIYHLDIIKQAGLLKDPLIWSISYPINYQVVSDQTTLIGPQEQTISTDLSRDRSFEIEFKK